NDLMQAIQSANAAGTPAQVIVDLDNQVVVMDGRDPFPFTIDPFKRHCLLNGLDDIGLTLQHVDAISKFEATRPAWLPSLA
ncbi:MAG: 3-isopropylmalate dehydratase small subunit, partial [Chthonomonadales bacterium]